MDCCGFFLEPKPSPSTIFLKLNGDLVGLGLKNTFQYATFRRNLIIFVETLFPLLTFRKFFTLLIRNDYK